MREVPHADLLLKHRQAGRDVPRSQHRVERQRVEVDQAQAETEWNLEDICCVAFSADGLRLASVSEDWKLGVRNARPWTPEFRAEREALSLIHFLRDQGQPQSEWLDAIAADQTLSAPVRQRALQFAHEWKP